MRVIASINFFTVKENIRNKIFHVLIIFAVIAIAASYLFSMLSGDVELRVIQDVGFGFIEFFALVTVLFSSSRLFLGEMENRSIYLALARPVKRWQYFLGRLSGIITVAAFNILVMGFFLWFIIVLKSGLIDGLFYASLFFIFVKISIIATLAVFFSLITTSALSSISMTFFLWICGHFANEIKFLNYTLKEKGIFITPFLRALYYIIPNMTLFNLRDTMPASFSVRTMVLPCVYALVYILSLILAGILIFENKEF